ncbi:AAA family ATPase [Nocardia farcinica]|uniref:AAA family ATPase n=2 Tax=Nocardia farcinica TaxID=37329 RepID=UPI001E655601|nr:AAA family ATPase [Nocardia farcinica]
MTDNYDAEGAATPAALSGAAHVRQPEPTAHCYDHAVYDAVCFSCQAAYREQIREERARRRDRSRTASGPGPEPYRGRTRTTRRNSASDQQKGAKVVVLESDARQDHAPDWSGPGPGPDQDRERTMDYGRYFDVAALLDGTLPEPPQPVYGTRTDARALFYAGEVNALFGDPESGKTWVALTAAREVLSEHGHGRVLVIDLDHNGAVATVSRLLALGTGPSVLADRERFLYVEPDSRTHLLAIIADMHLWAPDVVVLDSLGELLPLFGSSSNSADEYTTANSAVLKPLSKTGAAVLVIDHLAKGAESRKLGPGGTTAKRRAIGGVSLRVTVQEAFTPGKGGSAWLTVNKDRHGGVRQHCPVGREPVAGRFELRPHAADGLLEAVIHAPREGDQPPSFDILGQFNSGGNLAGDVVELSKLDPPPRSKRDVQERMGWGSDRAYKALKAWREERGES